MQFNNVTKVSMTFLLGVFSYLVSAQELDLDTRFDHARVLYNSGAFMAARQEFSTTVQGEYLEDSKYFIASCAVKSGQHDGEYLIVKFVESYPSNHYAQQAYFELGNYYYSIGNYKKALQNYEKGETDRIDELNFKLGYCQFSLKDYERAIGSFQKVENTNTIYEKDGAYFQGYIYYSRDAYESAHEFLEIAFDSEAYREDAIVLYVSSLYQMGKYRDVVKLISEEFPVPTNTTVLNYLADSQYALKAYDEAQRNYRQLFRKSSKSRNEKNYFKAGYSSYKVDKLDEAVEMLKRSAVADDSVGAYASYYLGLIYYGKGNLQFAVTSFSNTAKYDTELKEEAVYHQARTLVEMEDFESAINVLTDYKTNFSKGKYTSEVEEMLGIAYSHTDNYDLAIQYIESLPSLTLQIKKVYQRVSFIKAIELFNNKKFKIAADIFQKSLIHNVDETITQQSFYWMGECMSLLGREKESLFYYRSVNNNDRGLYLKALYGLGYGYFNLKEYQDAIDIFKKLELNYNKSLKQRYWSNALMRMGDCYFTLKAYEEGIIYYEKALTAGNKNIDQLYFQIGLLNRYLDKDEEAKRYFNKLIREVPSSTKIDHAQFQIAQIDFEKGNGDQAIAAYSKLLINYPASVFVPFALLSQAVAYDNQGSNQLSIVNYKAILDRFPRHETANSALLALQDKSTNNEFEGFDTYLALYKRANPNSEALENIEFETARGSFYSQKYESAIKGFGAFIEAYPSSGLIVEANFFIGDAYYRLDQFEPSLRSFYGIENEIDFSKYDRVLYRIAEMESALGNLEKGNSYFYQLSASSPSSRNVIFLERGLMENYFELEHYDSAIYYGNSLLDNSRVSVLIEATANLIIGKSEFNNNNYEEAMVYLLPLVSSSPDERGAEAYYYISKIYYEKEDYDKSLESLFSLTDNFNYEVWQGEAFLLMADVYVKTDELFQAKATLNSLVNESAIENIVKRAKIKLVEIDSMNSPDSTVSAND